MTGPDEDLVVYTPDARVRLGLLGVWPRMFKNIVLSRDLIWQLFRRDFIAVYKKSFLGMGWLLVTPILAILQWVFLQSTGLLVPGDTVIPYPAWVLLGSTMWGLFSGYVEHASDALTAGRQLILQVSFPHEVLVIKQAAHLTATFLISLALTLVVFLCFGIVPSWKIVFLPIVALPLFLLGSGIGLLFAMISAIAMDVKPALKVLLSLLMLTVPIVYDSGALSPEISRFIDVNPLAHLVCSCRDIIVTGELYDVHGFLLSSLMCCIVFMVCWKMFYVTEQRIIERMI